MQRQVAGQDLGGGGEHADPRLARGRLVRGGGVLAGDEALGPAPGVRPRPGDGHLGVVHRAEAVQLDRGPGQAHLQQFR